jgi:Putative Ig domain
VTSYAVNPTLPKGLSLNGSTGMIAGTPTTMTSEASYTVTASNSGGATTATVQIAVATPLPAPTGLMYPQTAIITYHGCPVKVMP